MAIQRKRTLSKRWRHWLQQTWLVYACVWTILWVLNALPVRLARFIGRSCGWLAYQFDWGHRRVSLENLALAFPEKSEAERRAILKACYEHIGIGTADFAHFRSIKAEEIRRDWVVVEAETEECLRRVLAQQRGVIGAAAHIGLWELMGFAFPALSLPLVSVARELAAPRLEALARFHRCRLGQQLVHKDGAVRALLRALRDQQAIGIIMDQYAGNRSPWVPFFSREASTVDTCAVLHLRTGAPLVCSLMIRRPDGRYTWRVRQIEVPPQPGETREQHIFRILRACNQEFEDGIRQAPEQWLWMHKRWRPKPVTLDQESDEQMTVSQDELQQAGFDGNMSPASASRTNA